MSLIFDLFKVIILVNLRMEQNLIQRLEKIELLFLKSEKVKLSKDGIWVY
jgi:hypothetical protein